MAYARNPFVEIVSQCQCSMNVEISIKESSWKGCFNQYSKTYLKTLAFSKFPSYGPAILLKINLFAESFQQFYSMF